MRRAAPFIVLAARGREFLLGRGKWGRGGCNLAGGGV